MSRKKPASLSPTRNKRDAVAATAAMGKLLPADEGDPAHKPITDWSAVSSEWCTVDDLLNYIATHGREGIPEDLMHQVFSRAYCFDISDAGVSGAATEEADRPQVTTEVLTDAGDCVGRARSSAFALKMCAAALTGEQRLAVEALAENIADDLMLAADWVKTAIDYQAGPVR